ncbi:YibE/F family protein [Clostridium aminobutyricum]|uniref:YibE/F family protein n=1 Tax=Clostridium aminobutyricum TaxID=33953 RepID=A0A939D986_CLOAM|nr:YibE/F family protein [Clostridium aminobutyricum]MBN7773407.1 YibE/F family protein [Clostridium aminobutyricum]
MNNNRMKDFMKKTAPKLAIIACCSILLIILAFNDYYLYNTPIAKIVEIKEDYSTSKQNGVYVEKYYTQDILAVIQNGTYKGEIVRLKNQYTQSGVYDDRFSRGNDVFIEKIENKQTEFTATISGKKRDQYVASAVVILVALLTALAGRKGIFVAASLAFNLVCFYYALTLYEQGINLLALMIPLVISFSILTLYFIGGWSRLTLVSLLSTLATVMIVTFISAVVLHFSDKVDYDFMEYLPQPYEQSSANIIFLSEILIGSLGAVMDIVVTMVSTVKELTQTSAHISSKELIASCRRVGDDILGTMINVMFFTNVASGIPFFLLCLRNEIQFTTIIRYNLFFEIARFLTGGIGIVLAIPISAFLAVYFYRGRKETC